MQLSRPVAARSKIGAHRFLHLSLQNGLDCRAGNPRFQKGIACLDEHWDKQGTGGRESSYKQVLGAVSNYGKTCAAGFNQLSELAFEIPASFQKEPSILEPRNGAQRTCGSPFRG